MKKIFLLDDNDEFLNITTMVLGNEYIIQSSDNTENISEKLKIFKPDLIIIDHFIGDQRSGEIMDGIKTANPAFKIPFILFSGSPDIEDNAQKLGAVGFIEKPSSISYIRSYIKGFFSNFK